MRRLGLALALVALAGASLPGTAGARERWSTHLLALVPAPGFPARAYVHPNDRIYEGTYEDPAGDTVPSRVFEYTGGGALSRSWTVPGQDLAQPHGVQVATSDAEGRLVLLVKSPARALVLDTRDGDFSRYATFRDLAPCSALSGHRPCSPTLRDQPPSPNYAAWGPNGALYVTDYLQGVVWRVPPGGGEARVWLADRRLDGDAFGTTGIVFDRERDAFLIAQLSSGGLGDVNPTSGKLYASRLLPNGRPGPLRELWESAPLDGPDGFWLAGSGRVYMALVGANQLVVLGRDGRELERFPELPALGANGSPVPFDGPSSAMFLGRSLIVANQSFVTGDPAHQAILDVFVGERGMPELIPAAAGPG